MVENQNLAGAIEGYTQDARGYAESARQFRSLADRLGMPWFVSPGNHERLEEPGAREAYLDVYELERTYYSIDFEGVHFVFLECLRAEDWKLDPPQLEWVEADLAANRDKDVFVIIHYAVADDGFVFDLERGRIPELQRLLEAHGRLRAVYSGHNNTVSAEVVNGILYVSSPRPTAGAHGYWIVEVYPDGLIQTFQRTPAAPLEPPRPAGASREDVDPELLRHDFWYRMGRDAERNFTWRYGSQFLSTGAR
jgi:hypothetical protein